MLDITALKEYNAKQVNNIKASMKTEPATNFPESRGWCDPGKGL